MFKGLGTLGRQIYERLFCPFGNPNFIFYFFCFVVVLSGVGLWITIFRYFTCDPKLVDAAARNVFENAATYSLAISVTALADIMLAKQVLSSFKLFIFLITVIVSICFGISFTLPAIGYYNSAWVATLIGTAVCWLQWWVINAENPTLEDDIDPSEVTGGNPLSGLQGASSLQGYRT